MDHIILVDALPRDDVNELKRLIRVRPEISLKNGKIHSVCIYSDKITLKVGDKPVIIKRREDISTDGGKVNV